MTSWPRNAFKGAAGGEVTSPLNPPLSGRIHLIIAMASWPHNLKGSARGGVRRGGGGNFAHLTQDQNVFTCVR